MASASRLKNTMIAIIAVSAAAATMLAGTSDFRKSRIVGTSAGAALARPDRSAAAALSGIGTASSSAGIANAVNTVPVVRTAANMPSEISAIRPARAASTVCTIPITSKAATSGTMVICKARSHRVPTRSASGSTHPAAARPSSTMPSASPAPSPPSVHATGTRTAGMKLLVPVADGLAVVMNDGPRSVIVGVTLPVRRDIAIWKQIHATGC